MTRQEEYDNGADAEPDSGTMAEREEPKHPAQQATDFIFTH
jgi:hypothetical protein